MLYEFHFISPGDEVPRHGQGHADPGAAGEARTARATQGPRRGAGQRAAEVPRAAEGHVIPPRDQQQVQREGASLPMAQCSMTLYLFGKVK